MTGSKRFATMLAVLTSTLPLAATAEDAATTTPGTFQIPGTDTTLNVYGFAEMDVTYDLHGRTSDINNNDWASFVAVQPFDNLGVDEPRKRQVYITGRASRLGIMSNTPTPLGPLTVRLEADFNAPNDFQGELSTNGTAFRVRHAYGQVGGLLIGQTWSTFLDLDSIPDTVDFNPAGALALTRQAMIRYAFSFGPASLALSVENPRGLDFSADYDAVPDFIANFKYGGSWGHVSARAVTHEFRNVERSKRAYGAGISGSVKFANETIIASVQAGDGIGRYMFNALLQGAFDTGEQLELWRSYAYHIGFTHAWNPQLRSNVIWTQTFFGENETLEAAQRTFSVNVAKSTDFVPNRRIDQLYVNTFWKFTKNTEIGLEYAYGKRSTFGPETGTQHRVNALARFSLY
ncbi:DcaP family trimeric outer membrane transporter [Archangium sp.]|uniref:DcaP family trimeric outer membrane transporter n=1 Tax=Archangium sp. TaxID=1872627 RepID=UPI002D36476F|nr:DcaP family trimeric outer membrane transporter [Archangium sp.]HYO52866.1 DcaP family trimeric outer membrane transporter [Archangium sp.]